MMSIRRPPRDTKPESGDRTKNGNGPAEVGVHSVHCLGYGIGKYL